MHARTARVAAAGGAGASAAAKQVDLFEFNTFIQNYPQNNNCWHVFRTRFELLGLPPHDHTFNLTHTHTTSQAQHHPLYIQPTIYFF